VTPNKRRYRWLIVLEPRKIRELRVEITLIPSHLRMIYPLSAKPHSSHSPLLSAITWFVHCCRTECDCVTDNECGVNSPMWARSINSSFLLEEVGRDSPSCD
jgi:hypothetical protein